MKIRRSLGRLFLCAVHFLVGLVGCHSETPVLMEVPANTVPMLVTPADLETGSNVRGMPAVFVYSPLIAQAFELQDGPAFLRSISVVTWPERERVAGAVVMIPPRESGELRHRFEFHASDVLGERWYAIILDVTSLGSTYSRTPPARDPAFEAGEIVQRFYPSSRPLLSASLYLDGDSAATLVVGATEALVADEAVDVGSLVTLEDSRGAIRCTTTSDDPRVELQTHYQLSFACDEIDRTAAVTVRVEAGLVSSTGIPLRDVMGRVEHLEATWVPDRDGDDFPKNPTDEFFMSGSTTVSP